MVGNIYHRSVLVKQRESAWVSLLEFRLASITGHITKFGYLFIQASCAVFGLDTRSLPQVGVVPIQLAQLLQACYKR